MIKGTLLHGNKAKLKRPSLAFLRCKSKFEIFELGLIAVKNEYSKFQAWPYCGANKFFKFSSLFLLRCKLTFKNFQAWPYFGANRLGLIAVHQCISNLHYSETLQ